MNQALLYLTLYKVFVICDTKTSTERYPSGSRGWFAKSLGGRKFPRGFESLPLRQINCGTFVKIPIMKRVFIIHGWSGSPRSDWLPWLAGGLRADEFQVTVPEMPNNDTPKIDEWVPFLSDLIGKADKDTYFVGHSIGCQTILRYLEGLDEDVRVGGIVFVAPWFHLRNLSGEEEEKIAEPWIKTPIDFSKVKSHCRDFIAIFSDNDPFVPLTDKELFEKNLGAKTTVLNNLGHMSTEDGVLKLQEAYAAITSLVD